MATTFETSLTQGALRAQLAVKWAEFADRARRYFIYVGTQRALHQLPDRTLADLGMTRSQIRARAWEAAYGK